MARLKHEFLTMLIRQSEPFGTVDSITSDWSSLASTAYEDYLLAYNSPSDEVIFYLRHVAKRLNSNRHLGDCIKVHKSVRKSFFHTLIKQLHLEGLYRGGNEKRFLSTFKKKRFLWEELKVKIERWIQVARLCFCYFFDWEKQISEKLFSGFGNGASEECFWEIVGDSTNNLLVFVETLSSNFEKAVFGELSPIQDKRGATHSLTKRVMNYISLIVCNKELLTDLIISMPPLKFGDQLDLKGKSHLALHFILIIVVLQLNLKGKSEQLNHVSLRHLFMMNNVHYIVEKIEESKELRQIIGDDYMEKLYRNVKQAMTSYQVSTCDKFLSCCQEEGLYVTWCFSTRVSKPALRKGLKSINSVFEEIQTLQTNWIVHDSELLNKLRASMVDKLIPAYKKFHAEI
ncbi:exocyst complex component EXO70A1-like [Olea europaea var. sylvestris]|uniref:exocyst complex component EXO70A1-like n=1 Tax=Olea europaea var. sylvestris TaxID=158386 RepID=UPI000C1D052A|nr:exocyst complex component EXO70A1-like [Olea europaea var. sylvestris]